MVAGIRDEMMQYKKFDQGTWVFPKPKVSALPTLSRRSLRLGNTLPLQAVTRGSSGRLYTRSRYALTDAYRLCGLGPDTTLLAPAYHCRTMLDPAIRLGAEIALYALRPNLAPDFDALEASLASCDKAVTALLVTHYFGFPQDLEPALAFCEDHGIALIEDCSHCLITPLEASDLGQIGRYSVWSPYKFFPCEDGGVLWANHGAPLPSAPPRSPSISSELKGIARSLQRSWEDRQPLNAKTLEQDLEILQGSPAGVSQDNLRHSAETSSQYDADLENIENLAGSRWIIRHTDIERLTSLRRKNYQEWAQAVAGLPHCHALFPVLPDACVPYMFPLFIQFPDVHFLALKSLGMTEWRWDDMAVSSSPVAMDYRLHLLHLPCHQELTRSQMIWMTTAVSKVLTQIPATRLAA
jgi:perosamine synthetase